MKKNENLLESMSDISEKYVSEATPKNTESKPKKKLTWTKGVCAAACLAVIVGVQYCFLIKPLSDIKNSSTAESNVNDDGSSNSENEKQTAPATQTTTELLTSVSENTLTQASTKIQAVAVTGAETEITENTSVQPDSTQIPQNVHKETASSKVTSKTENTSAKISETSVTKSTSEKTTEAPKETTSVTTWLIVGEPLYSGTQTTYPAQISPPLVPAEPEYQLDFNAKYIRTDGYIDGEQYPKKIVIRNREELEKYYNENKDKYSFENQYGEEYYADYSPSFKSAVSGYDEQFFNEHDIILVVLEEGSGSITHKVKEVLCRTSVNGTPFSNSITIEREMPEVGTDDMAEWHIIIEVEKNSVSSYTGDISLNIVNDIR